MEEQETCTICADTIAADDQTTVLDCSHSFHVNCIIEWFRYNHTECPNCRSDGGQRGVALTNSQRISRMRRLKHRMPSFIVQKLKKLDGARKRLAESRKEMKELKRNNAVVFKEETRLRVRMHNARRCERATKRELSYHAFDAVPLMNFGHGPMVSVYDTDSGVFRRRRGRGRRMIEEGSEESHARNGGEVALHVVLRDRRCNGNAHSLL